MILVHKKKLLLFFGQTTMFRIPTRHAAFPGKEQWVKLVAAPACGFRQMDLLG